MKNVKRFLQTGLVSISLLLVQTIGYAQFPGLNCNNDGICDSVSGGEQAGVCADCPFDIPGGGFTGAPIKPSAGDDPCSATPLKTGLACKQYSNDTSTATSTPGKPACWGDVQKDVWFSFIATSEDMTISTDAVIFELFPGTSNNDTELAYYTGSSCSSLTELGCDEDSGINSGIDLSAGTSSPTRQAMVEKTGLTIGQTYYIRVQGKAGAKGNFCVSAFDTYTVGSKACEAQAIHPNNMGSCDYNDGNAVKNKISSGSYDAATTMQPNAYVPLGTTFSCAPQITADQYGGWVKWTAGSDPNITVENISGGARDYTLFEASICINLQCIETKTNIANGGTTSFSGLTAGTTYYLLTTLAGGGPSDGFITDVCVKNSTAPLHPETEKNLDNVPGAGGTQQADQCPAFEIVVDQVYETTTYAADVDGAASCAYGKNVWFTWKVPSDYPTVNGAQAAFFQMWSKNCTGGPGSPGTRLIVGAEILGDPCNGSCLEFSSPSQTGASGSSGDIDPYTDAATNVGWDPSQYGKQYWGVFQSGNDGSGQEVCDFNFMIGSTPSLKGITVPDATICLGETVTLTAEGATGYEWFDGTTGPTYTDAPTTNTSYTVYATAGAEGYSVGYVTVITPPVVTVNNGGICSGATAATLTASGAEVYEWSPATNLDVTTGATVNASPSSTTVYTVTGINGRVTGTYEGRDDYPGCSATADATVTVGGSIPIQVNSGVVCAGESATLTASGADTYTWNPTSDLTNMNADSAVASPSAPITYTVTGEINGCFGTAEAPVTLSPAAVITVESLTICSGLNATVNAAGGSTYLWSDGSTGTSLTLTNVTAPTSYTVTGTDANGCSASAVGTISIAPGLTITVNDASFCDGGTGATLTASGGTTYDWTPSASLSSSVGTSVTATPTVTTTYTVVGNSNGCVGEAVATVTIDALDDANFSYSGATFCAPSSDTPVRTTPGTGTFSISPASNLSIDPSSGMIDVLAGTNVGKYIITLTTTDACPNTYTVSLDVVGNPDATFTYAGPYCQGDTPNATITQAAGSTPGVFSATPAGLAFANVNSGEIDLAISAPGDYTVTNTIAAGNGCPAAVETNAVSIKALPVITTTSPPAACVGTPSTITTSGGTGTTTYAWSDASSGNSLTDAPSVTSTYTVTPTDNGCVGAPVEGTIAVDTIPVTLVNDGAVCGGSAATLTASGATTYVWSNGSTDPTLTDTPTGTTSYTVTGTASSGCSSDAIGTITLASTPTVTVSNSEICSGQPGGATLTANGAITYVWSTTDATPSINVNPTATATYTVTGDMGGCTDTAIATVSVVATPTVTVTNMADVCEGDPSTATAAGAITYVWSTGDATATINVTPTGPSQTYTVTGTSGTCTDTKTVTVIVNPIPDVTATNATICLGESASLTADGADTYLWSEGTVGATLANKAPTTTTPYTVTGTTSALCPATATGTITVNPNPIVSVNNAAVCEGVPAILTASSNVALTYSWSPGGGVGNSITVNPTTPTLYTVTGTDQFSCSDTAVGLVAVSPAPNAAFDSPGTIKLSEAAITFIDGSSNADAWLWDFGDTATSTLKNPFHIYTDTGSYSIMLKVVSNGGCADSVIHNIYIVPDVLVYIPNAFSPNGDDVNDGFRFKGEGIPSEGFQFFVFDRWGEQMFFTSDQFGEWDGKYLGVPCPQDVYVYVIIVKDGLGKEKKYLGQVSLVR